ncbi:hypothetical protein ABRZ88_10675 [Vibrio vulnificus]|uniref:hypothetical protein n=1 Tax=Vibrio vulnificus TaxID=672 RepID=UPI0032EBD83A
MTKHASDSSEQQTAVAYILQALALKRGFMFCGDNKLPIDLGVKPDAIDVKNKVVVEVYARVGELKGAQLHKVKGDILKLLLIQEHLGENWRKVLCFASEDAAKYAKGKSWVAKAVSTFGIEVEVIELPVDIRENVLGAQKRQIMTNAQ